VIISFVTALLISVVLIFCLKLVALRVGLVAEPGEHRQHSTDTPLVGGAVIYFAFVLTLYLLGELGVIPNSVLIALTVLFVFGLADDLWDIPFWVRFVAQIFASYLLVSDGVILLDLGYLISAELFTLGRWSTALSVFAMVGVINAVNMIDGIDGLLGSLSIVILLALVMVLGATDNLMISIFVMIGAISGFLLFNFRFVRESPARIFMGDSGSLFLGVFFAWILVSKTQGQSSTFPPVVALWILAIPLFDTVGVMLRRIAKRKSPFHADRTHTHHTLLEMGYEVRTVVIIMSLVSIVSSAVGIFAYKYGMQEYILFYLFLFCFIAYVIWIETVQRRIHV
jgi:UDP-GlcNAc:undecaprenyl-phosphate GlcNAc-1-phosphate transferase